MTGAKGFSTSLVWNQNTHVYAVFVIRCAKTRPTRRSLPSTWCLSHLRRFLDQAKRFKLLTATARTLPLADGPLGALARLRMFVQDGKLVALKGWLALF